MTKSNRRLVAAILETAGGLRRCCSKRAIPMEPATAPTTPCSIAARAALLVSAAPVHAEVARTHSGLIAAFGLHLVKTGQLDAELGRALNRAQQVRMVADYTGDPVDLQTARDVVEQAVDFVSRIQRFSAQGS